MTERRVRVRFAPSPTGALHIGGVRTALYNYLFARQHGGDMIFRIEDTDSNRFVPGAEEYILESFKWLGIPFDEGVSFGGEYGPYRQSERREIYKKYVKVLLENDEAYIAFDTPEELDAKRAEIANFQYDASTRMQMRNSLTLSKEEVDALIAEEKEFKKQVKAETAQLLLKTKATIEALTDAQVLELLELKWIHPLVGAINQLPTVLIQTLTTLTQALSDQYATTYADVAKEITSTEDTLADMIDELTGNAFDMQGLAEFKTFLKAE